MIVQLVSPTKATILNSSTFSRRRFAEGSFKTFLNLSGIAKKEDVKRRESKYISKDLQHVRVSNITMEYSCFFIEHFRMVIVFFSPGVETSVLKCDFQNTNVGDLNKSPILNISYTIAHQSIKLYVFLPGNVSFLSST